MNTDPKPDRAGRYPRTSNAADRAIAKRHAPPAARAPGELPPAILRSWSFSRWLFIGRLAFSAQINPVALLRPRQKSPIERFILAIILAQSERRQRLGHFIAQVKRVPSLQRFRCGG